MSNLTHDFIQFLIENYGIQLIMSEKDSKKFKEQYPDLIEQMEKKNETANNCT